MSEAAEAIEALSPEARALFESALTRRWTVADGLEAECRELGEAGLCWWRAADPEGGIWRNTTLAPYPAARAVRA